MSTLVVVVSVGLAAVFSVSAISKLLLRPDMTELGLPPWSATAVAGLELALAVLLVVHPPAGGVATLAVLAGFTTFLARRLGTGTGCACFGSTASPVRWWHLARNGVLLVLAGVAAFG